MEAPRGTFPFPTLLCDPGVPSSPALAAGVGLRIWAAGKQPLLDTQTGAFALPQCPLPFLTALAPRKVRALPSRNYPGENPEKTRSRLGERRGCCKVRKGTKEEIR